MQKKSWVFHVHIIFFFFFYIYLSAVKTFKQSMVDTVYVSPDSFKLLEWFFHNNIRLLTFTFKCWVFFDFFFFLSVVGSVEFYAIYIFPLASSHRIWLGTLIACKLQIFVGLLNTHLQINKTKHLNNKHIHLLVTVILKFWYFEASFLKTPLY